MSMLSNLVWHLREYSKKNTGATANLLNEAARTIEVLSAKLSAANLERSSQYYNNGWIPCSERLPDMHDAGILKKLGIKEQSNKCIITVAHETESVVDNDAWLNDGKWYSDYLRFLEAGKKPFEVTAWMPLPEPYVPKEDE